MQICTSFLSCFQLLHLRMEPLISRVLALYYGAQEAGSLGIFFGIERYCKKEFVSFFQNRLVIG